MAGDKLSHRLKYAKNDISFHSLAMKKPGARRGKKENDEDEGCESNGWRWQRDGDYMIVMTILSGFEKLRNQFLYIMGRIRTF